MKLSEAILLGSTVMAPRAGGQHFSETQEGCALGMAAVARGCTFRPVRGPVDDRERRTLGVEGVWGNWVLEQVDRPCNCWRIWIRRRMRIKEVIAHLFDYHVMDKKNWTLEQLAAWVETVEPQRVQFVTAPRFKPQTRELLARELQRMKQEADEWQAVREAFEAQHASRRQRRTGVSPSSYHRACSEARRLGTLWLEANFSSRPCRCVCEQSDRPREAAMRRGSTQ